MSQRTTRVSDLTGERPRRLWGLGCLLPILVGFGFFIFAGPYAEYLWYAQDAARPEVLLKELEARSTIFSASLLFSVLFLYFNLRAAMVQQQTVFSRPPEGWGPLLANISDLLVRSGATVAKAVAPVLGVLAASGLAANWMEMLASGHAKIFGKTDPLFGLDYSFFVFKLPWYEAILGFALGLCILTFIICAISYAIFQGLAAASGAQLASRKIWRHLGVLGGVSLLILGAQVWLERYDLAFADGTQFTGAGYATMVTLNAQALLAVLLGLGGLIVVLNGLRGRSAVAPIASVLIVNFGVFILGLGVAPSLVQRFKVEPDKVRIESPFASRAIDATRFGFGLEGIDAKNVSVSDEPTSGELDASKVTLDNMRLWDPQVLRQSAEGIQGLKPYYTFDDVDVDRYTLDGQKRLVMLAARNIRIGGLNPQASAWINTRLQYTHGYGVVMAEVNEATRMGQPSFVIQDMPLRTPPDLPVNEPRLYFSDYNGREAEYALVDTNTAEFDYPNANGGETHRWTSSRGIHVAPFWTRLAFSYVLSDFNLLISGNIQSSTRLLMHRDVRDRAQKLYPFLQFDGDPYVVILEGRIYWILDGYTSSANVPYSQHEVSQGRLVNYVRNPVKVVVDAYTGETTGYVVDPEEPILKTYREVWPALFKDLSDAPKGMREHFRYPEEMFMLQAHTLTQYHVTDPTQFLTNQDAWEMPFNRGLKGDRDALQAYYVLMALPGEKRENFMLILPFTPSQKDNMSGWLAAYCDPENYGKLVLYKFTKGALVPGPAQMESIFNQDKVIADINRQLSNDQSSIIVGNLLVVPIGGSVMYVEPLFLQSRTQGIQPIPELKKVILALKGKVVVGDTYEEARQKLFGGSLAPPPQTDTGAPPPVTVPGVPATKASEALKLFDQADQALRSGDFAKYGELQKQLKQVLKDLVEAK